MTFHQIIWTLEPYGRFHGKATCSAPDEADCRLVGTNCLCEEWGEIKRDAFGPYHEVEVDLGELAKHRMHDQGECNVALYLNESDIEECGSGGYVEIGRTPIEPVWEGDGYTWRPARAAQPA